MKTTCLVCVATLASAALACQREHKHAFHAHRALSKRQETAFPPALTQEESILTASIDNNTIEQWSVLVGCSAWRVSDLVFLGTITMPAVTTLQVQTKAKPSGRQIILQNMASKAD